MSSVSEKILEYTQDSTLHGVNHVTDKKRNTLQRLLWLLLFLIAFCTVIALIVNGFTMYYSYPISSKMEYFTERSMEFPTVTICNNNMVRKSYIEEMDTPTVGLLLALQSLTPDAQMLVNFSDPSIIAQLQSVDMEKQGAESAHRMEEMFLECLFPGADASQHPCQFQDEDLFKVVATTEGFCFSFHSASYIDKHGALMSIQDGISGGLRMLVDIQQEEYQVAATRSAGITLLVHDPYTYPRVDSKGVAISPGTDARIDITKTVYENLPPPYEGSICRDTNPDKDPDFVNPLQFFQHYSFDACREECMRQYILSQCGCVAYTMTAPNVTVCDMYIFMACVLPSLDIYFVDDSIEAACDCFHPCEETKYSVSLSAASLPNEFITPTLETQYGKNKEYFKQNWIELKIFFGELGYTKVTQTPAYPLVSLIAESGGLMGLFIGASVLTMAEVLEAILDTLLTWCNRKQNLVTTVHVQSSK